MARDASFYRWPPAIRLFHPFVPHSQVPRAAGRLPNWIDEVCENVVLEENDWECDNNNDDDDGFGFGNDTDAPASTRNDDNDDNGRLLSVYLRPFDHRC